MLRMLLAERFKLVAHHEDRVLPMYELVTAGSDGRLGPQMRASAVDCAALVASRRGAPGPQTPPGQRPTCGMSGRRGQIIAGSTTTASLAATLSRMMNEPVVDKTGLTGGFDFDLNWAPDLPVAAPGLKAPDGARDDSPSIFTALPEQIGLKLKSAKAPVDVLVIDHVERPTPN